jgi:hypothetical protein
MSSGQSGSLLAPVIFIICLTIWPQGGFFLAIAVCTVIYTVVTGPERREERNLREERRKRLETQPLSIPQPPFRDKAYRDLLKDLGVRDSDGESAYKPIANRGTDVPSYLGPGAIKYQSQRLTLAKTAGQPDKAFIVMTADSFLSFLSTCAGIIAICLTGSLFVLESPTAGLALWCSLAWFATFLLVRSLLERREETSSLPFLFAKNGIRFVLVFAAAAVVALLLPGVFRQVPLSRVLGWRDHLELVRERLKGIELKSGATLALVIGLFIVRYELPRWKIGSKLESLWKVWDRGSDWMKHIAFALAALFCFSFTGTLHGNVVDILQTEIKDLDRTYDQLAWDSRTDCQRRHAYNYLSFED